MEAARARTISSGEVNLIPLEQADLQELAGAMEDRELKRRLNYYNAPDMIVHLRRQIDRDRSRGELTWAIYQSGSPKGICGIWPFDPRASLGVEEWQPGFEGVIYLAQDARGSGLSQIVASLLLREGQKTGEALMVTIGKDNPRSLAFAHKAFPGAEVRECRERMRNGSVREIEALLIQKRTI